MSDYRLIYSTWPDAATAEDAANAVVRSGLAACANILPGAVSVFRWEGKLQREQEAVMLLKTTADEAPALVARLAELHPYDTPALVALAIDGRVSAAKFLDWIGAACGPEPALE